MHDVEALRHAIAEIIPFNHVLDISITAVSTEHVELTQPEAHERLNYIGVPHTGASTLFMLGEAAAEAMAIHAFYHLIREEGVVPFVVETTITYHHPTRGKLRGISTLSQEEQARVRTEIAHIDHTQFTLDTYILNESDILVAQLKARWGLMRPRTKE